LANLNQFKKLSIICPILNEEQQLPLLIADINLWPYTIDLQFVDGGSRDYSVIVSRLSGANVSQVIPPNRGSQLHTGAIKAESEWLLFIHADSRLHPLWAKKLFDIVNNPLAKKFYWYFDFKTKEKGITFRLLEVCVYLRSKFFRTPYGDQGLLINKELYIQSGGYSNLHIMEDLDLINRLNKNNNGRRIGLPILTSGRKWKKNNVLNQAIKNYWLRYKWRKGESSKKLLKDYYKY
tara:strand:- start:253 stop:960 length:708 start_codon:yes stop_codon:yes gene_type:complete